MPPPCPAHLRLQLPPSEHFIRIQSMSQKLTLLLPLSPLHPSRLCAHYDPERDKTVVGAVVGESEWNSLAVVITVKEQ